MINYKSIKSLLSKRKTFSSKKNYGRPYYYINGGEIIIVEFRTKEHDKTCNCNNSELEELFWLNCFDDFISKIEREKFCTFSQFIPRNLCVSFIFIQQWKKSKKEVV